MLVGSEFMLQAPVLQRIRFLIKITSEDMWLIVVRLIVASKGRHSGSWDSKPGAVA